MNNFAFWSDWEKPFQWTFKILVSIFILSIFTFLIIQWGDMSPVYYWKLTGYIENLNFPVFSNHSEFIESTIHTDLPIIFQKVFGGSKTLPSTYTYVYLILLYICLMGCLTISTYLEKFYYYMGIGLWILLVVLSGIGNVGFFDLYNQSAIIVVLLLFIPVSYYFNAINEHVAIGWRFLSFSALILILFALIYLGSTYEEPLLFLARFSYLPAALICVVFILIIGHEIIYAILTLTTPYAKNSSNNTTHFLVLSIAYLLNLAVLYLNRINYLDWNIYYLNEFALIAISGVLGIWGIKSRENRYAQILPYYPYTAILYLALGLITFFTLAFQGFHANDAFIRGMESMILYSHIGFGLMFFLYVIFNFITQLRQNLPVHQFAYVEDNFPYISARIAGLIIVAALFFRAHYDSFYLGVAGYYNGLGDLNLALENKTVAKYYFQESVSKNTNNHHGNFQLAQLEDEPLVRLNYLKNAIKQDPSPYAYATLGKNYENNNQYFEALFTYQDGIKSFSGNWAIQNNIALLYNKTNVLDSALYYLENSSPSSWEQAVIEANKNAIASMHGIKISLERNEDLDRFDLQSNSLANRLINEDTSRLEFVLQPQNIVLNLFTFSYLKNLGIYCYQNRRPEYLQIIEPYLESNENAAFRKELDIIKAFNLFEQGNVSKAIEIIYQLKEVYEDEESKWNVLLGKWYLELGAPLQASKYLEAAREAYFPKVSADLAQAYYRIGDESIALFLLSKEIEANNSNLNEKEKWAELFENMQKGQSDWKNYSFENEIELLKQAKKGGAEQHLLFEQLGTNNPFFEDGVIAAAEYFEIDGSNDELTYNILRQAITINEYSERLTKTYIEHCLKQGLVDFAEDAMIKLIDILPREDYLRFEADFEKRKDKAQTQLDQDW